MIRAPSAASRCAVARPMPDDAPVITAVLPSKRRTQHLFRNRRGIAINRRRSSFRPANDRDSPRQARAKRADQRTGPRLDRTLPPCLKQSDGGGWPAAVPDLLETVEALLRGHLQAF